MIKAQYYLKNLVGGLAISLMIPLLLACTSSAETPVATPEIQVEVPDTPLPPLGAATSIPDEPTPEISSGGNEAEITSVNILQLESFPVQVNVTIQGALPDGCTSIDRIDQQREGDIFTLTVITTRDIAALCQEQSQPFEETVSLDVVGLPAGSYTVVVNGQNSMSSSFELTVDNVLPAENSAPSGNTSISGIVWEDLCQLANDGSPSAGCVTAEQGGYRADGIFDSSEARLAGIEVSLAPGECPGGEVIATAVTDESGTYIFSDLQPGVYCVFVDALEEPNAPLLLPGGWTYPALEVGSLTVAVGTEQTQTADFGWDPQFDMSEAGPEVSCEDQAVYVADVTIPDDALLSPEEAFVKTWRIRNEGSCIWGSGYNLVFAGGEQLRAPTAVPVPQVVEPGTEVDLSIPLVAPASEGTYRSDWLLQNDLGEVFGSRGEFPFYVQIVVEGAGTEPSPTPPPTDATGATITGLVWEDRCHILNNGSPSAECIVNEVGGYQANGLLDEDEQPIAGIQVKVSAGECPGSQVMFATVETDINGIYRFSGLQPGPHCVSIDAEVEPNASILLPGDWTYPGPGQGWTTTNTGADETQNINFGWNYHLY